MSRTCLCRIDLRAMYIVGEALAIYIPLWVFNTQHCYTSSTGTAVSAAASESASSARVSHSMPLPGVLYTAQCQMSLV